MKKQNKTAKNVFDLSNSWINKASKKNKRKYRLELKKNKAVNY